MFVFHSQQGEDIFIDSLLGIGSFKTDIVNAVGSSSTKGKRDGKQIFSSFKIRETFKQNELLCCYSILS